jgi:hypothetical protein
MKAAKLKYHFLKLKYRHMKPLSPLFPSILLFATLMIGCNRPSEGTQSLQPQIDSLRLRLTNLYKPGMGEIMSNIQFHHAKLWFAGENKNWPLAEYNESLIQSAFKRIQLFHGDKSEAKAASMIYPSMDSISNAIRKKDTRLFERSFLFMTNTCNNCHAVTRHDFNVITIPKIPPVTNQDFKSAVMKPR